MKIVLLGYGKMGREIEKIAVQRGHEIVLKVDKNNASTLKAADLKAGDIAIEFSTPATVIQNMKHCFEAGIPVVVGTTGWYGQFDEISQLCTDKNATLFHATNFSVGVNLFFKVNRYLAELMNRYSEYDVSMEEIHHIHKLDKPSGTAITLAEQILENIERKKKWELEDPEKTTSYGQDKKSDNQNRAEILLIKDKREGEVPGTHIIRYSSAIDDIEIMHKAHNRQGFALGSVLAAEFVKNKKGIYTMKDLI